MTDQYDRNLQALNALAPGLYRARTDVRNPSPDRRKRRDWTSQTVWYAGEIYCLARRNYGTLAEPREIPRVTQLFGSYSDSLGPADDGVAALAESLEPYEPQNTRELLRMLSHVENIDQGAEAILDAFIRSNLLTLAMVRRMAEVCEAEDRARYDAECAALEEKKAAQKQG